MWSGPLVWLDAQSGKAHGVRAPAGGNQRKACDRPSLCVDNGAVRADSHALGDNAVWVRAPAITCGGEAQGLAQNPDRRARQDESQFVEVSNHASKRRGYH
jgi:hypothetical protein